IEALGRGGEGLEVRIVEGPHGRMIQHIQVLLAEDEVDGVGLRAIGKDLAGKNHAVAGETGIDRARDTVASAIAEVGHNIRTGILVEGTFEMRILPATDLEVQQATDLSQTADFEHARERTGEAIEDLVD